MHAEPKCSKCGGTMTEGAILQKLDGLMVPISVWVEGQPERTLLGSTRMPPDKTRAITTFRCAACGLLELHAPEP